MFTLNTIKTAFFTTAGITLLLLVTLKSHAVQAPSFSLPASAGGTVLEQNIDLGKFKDQVVYVDFWASWCTPCKKSFPWMNEMHNRYAKQGFNIIAVNLDDDKSKAEQFLSEVPSDFIVAYDPEGKTAEQYNLRVMPSSYLINGKGEIVMAHRGFKGQDKNEIEQKIRSLLLLK